MCLASGDQTLDLCQLHPQISDMLQVQLALLRMLQQCGLQRNC